MMQMFFQFSESVTLLFDFWQTHGPGGLVGSLLILIVAAIAYEALKVARWRIEVGEAALRGRGCGANGSGLQPASDSQSTQESQGRGEATRDCFPRSGASGSDGEALRFLKPIDGAQRRPVTRQLLLTLLHIVQVGLGYLLMLTVMTYNAWVFLAVVLGAALGYLLAYPFLPATLLLPAFDDAAASPDAPVAASSCCDRSDPWSSAEEPARGALLEGPQPSRQHSEA